MMSDAEIIRMQGESLKQLISAINKQVLSDSTRALLYDLITNHSAAKSAFAKLHDDLQKQQRPMIDVVNLFHQSVTSISAEMRKNLNALAANYSTVLTEVDEVFEDYVEYSESTDETWKEETPSNRQVENIVNIYQTINIPIDKSSVKTKMYYFKLVAEIISLIVSLITVFSFAESKIEEHNSSSTQRPGYSLHDLNNSDTHNDKTVEEI